MAGFIFISEFHYDDASVDDGEFIELTGTDGFDLTGWSIVLYNGSDQEVYNSNGTINLSGTITEERDGFGTHVVDLPTNGLQNGGPDGIALVNPDGTAVEFISYEGTFTASGGPADGIESDDIGVSESGSTVEGSSLEYNANTDSWQVNSATNTKGSVGVSIPCFLTGTEVTTKTGLKTVEALQIGDEVLTTEGTYQQIKWLGHRQVATQFAGAHSNPICISAGALGNHLPVRDLYVSPDHAMYVDGVLVQAQALVNGSSITQIQCDEDFTYYHIELDAHALIYAEGAATETFVDADVRSRFDNADEFEALYPNAEPVVALALPRIKSKRQLPAALKTRIVHIKTA